MATVIENCVITHENSELLKSYDALRGTECFHTGVDIKATDIYTPCCGVCIYTGLIEDHPSCTIQYSPNICVRFTHLKEVLVNQGQVIEYDQKVGIADQYVHFEYLTSQRSYPYFRVFFQSETSYYMYKHDPMLILSGNAVFDNSRYIKVFQALYEDGKGPDE